MCGTVDKILGCKSKGNLEEIITTPAASVNSFTPKLTYIHNSKIAVNYMMEIIWNKMQYLLLSEMY